MKLRSLNIKFNEWGPFEGRYTGEVECFGEAGKVSMALTPEMSNELLKTCGEQIVKISMLSAQELQKSIQFSIEEAKSPALTV